MLDGLRLPRTNSRQCRLVLLCLAFTVLNGCAMVKIRSITTGDYVQERRADVLSHAGLSASSYQTLQVAGLYSRECERLVDRCIGDLNGADGISEESRMSTLSELWLVKAGQLAAHTGRPGPLSDEALEAYLEATRHAYAYLFFTERNTDQRRFEGRQAQVLDYYNFGVQTSTSDIFRRHVEQMAVEPSNQEGLVMGQWEVSADMTRLSSSMRYRTPSEIVPASALRFKGLRNTYRRDGLGADMVAVADSITLDDPGSRTVVAHPSVDPFSPADPAYSEMPSPATTVLLKFEGESLEAVMGSHKVVLMGFDPYQDQTVSLAGRAVPLSANFTAGYGLWLARASFSRQSIRSLLGTAKGLARPHIYMMQPFDPNRKIVLMLHGLASSPEAWVNVANELQGDDLLRSNYQIWQIYYPTNRPILWNHRAIREAIVRTLDQYDPGRSAPASRDMVVIGHSMGGVIGRLMISKSDDQLWEAFLSQSDENKRPEAEKLRVKMEQWLQFDPLPEIGRAVFIAAPQKGTPLAGKGLARFIGRLVKLPASLTREMNEVSQVFGSKVPTSIDNLRDTDPVIVAASKLPISYLVPYHTIIAQKNPSIPLIDSDDGVVPYKSAHLEGAASEKTIISGHSVQEMPEAIVEIRRLLELHLDELDKTH